jgi:CheY-like chemotaxis protein
MSTPADKISPLSVETILVIDNDVLVRKPISQYLRDCGYRVLEVASADEAVAILQKPSIQIDVILSDIEMSGSMNGFGFARWARSVRPGIQIVLAGTPGRTVQAAAELCDDGPMFMKPYDHKIVLEHIKRLLAARVREDGS